jgi:nitroimidazol reductase NimA-like FMN-containing flavoprotein (pyridoxamine 5'-phosphate oxidase superfamily)
MLRALARCDTRAVIDGERLSRLQEASYGRADATLRGSWPTESAMGAAELAGLLNECHWCVLATTDAHGYAQARPVAFTVVGASFWFATVGGARLRNLQRTPWASLVVAAGEGDQHRAVAADGPTIIVAQPAEELVAAWRERHGSRGEWAAAWLELQPARLFSYAPEGARR